MEENNQCCLSCLGTEVEFNIEEFTIQCEPLKAIFQVDKISLCYLCTRIVQHTQLFIQNVQSNQILLENFHGDLSSIQSVRSQVQPSITLAINQLPSIKLSGTGYDEELSIISSRDLRIKLELKEELDHLEGEFIDGNDNFQDYVKEEDNYPLNSLLKEEIELDSIDSKSLRKTLKSKKVKKKGESKIKDRVKKKLIDFQDVKEEDNYPLNSLLKEEIELDSIDLKTLRKTLKSKKVKNKGESKIKDRVKKKLIGVPKIYTKVHISEAQCVAERVARTQAKAYLNSTYRCEPCGKGFTRAEAYQAHAAKHSPSRGEFECSICTIRYDTAAKLATHTQGHTVRYKCPECDLICAGYGTIREHFTAKHSNYGYCEFKCPHCPKVFSRAIALRKHKNYLHSGKDKVSCEICHNSYVNKDSLRAHYMRKHPRESNCVATGKRYICQDCGKAFKVPSQLRNHSLTHTDLRPFYCVECDRSFKTAYILSHHLKTAAPHINYAELRYHCQHCDKRFAVKRDVVRHTNRVHLNIKPHPCDKCERAYINSWSLMEHKRYTHEGVKRPLRYPCPMCDKVFDRNSILKSHKRTHTGERPYQCARCPATFAQASARGTHVKLIHLKLTRAGRPKPSPAK